MTRAAKFTQADIARALRAAQAAGMHVVRCEIDRDGKLVIVFQEQAPQQEARHASDVVYQRLRLNGVKNGKN